MQQAEIESYIVGNGGVESAMGTVGVEFRGTGGTSGAGVVLRVESFTNESCIKRTFLGVGLHGTEATHGELSYTRRDGGKSESESDTSGTLSTGNKENLLKRGYFSGCFAAALVSILGKNPPRSG